MKGNNKGVVGTDSSTFEKDLKTQDSFAAIASCSNKIRAKTQRAISVASFASSREYFATIPLDFVG